MKIKKLLVLLSALSFAIGSIITGVVTKVVMESVYKPLVDKQKEAYVLSDNEVVHLTIDYTMTAMADWEAQVALDLDINYLQSIFNIRILSTHNRRVKLYLLDAKTILYFEDEIYIFNDDGTGYMTLSVDSFVTTLKIEKIKNHMIYMLLNKTTAPCCCFSSLPYPYHPQA
jgi:hypothetical protein